MPSQLTRCLFAVLVCLLAGCAGPSVDPDGVDPDATAEAARRGGGEELTVFAAASLRDVVSELTVGFESSGGARVTVNFAGSNTLAQQIRAAPGADVFLSADEQWVSFLEERGRIAPGSARPFLGNSLVLIARGDAPFAAEPWSDLSPLLAGELEHLALADPAAVPAGRYAKAHLERLAAPGGGDLWSHLEERVVPALDVRAALQLVASDPRIAGIVYRTDALVSGDVRVLYELPPLAEVPIVYWAVRLDDARAPGSARAFMDFLGGPAALEIFERFGFGPPPREPAAPA